MLEPRGIKWTILAAVLAAACAEGAESMQPDATNAASRPSAFPAVTCTASELSRLREAWRGTGAAHAVMAEQITSAAEGMAKPVIFPLRGGQHNQWYQCDPCQTALVKADDTHHRCPTCGKVYTGEPYDDVVFTHIHAFNLKRMLEAAWAYAVTEDPSYAAFAKQILLGYAARYRQYPYHCADRTTSVEKNKSGGHLFEQTLNESATLSSQVAPAFDLIRGALLPDEDAAIRDGLLRPMLVNIDRYKHGKSNWQTWHNAGLLWGGAVLGETAWVDKALRDPDNGFYRQMEISVSAEGMWYENSWGYHVYTLTAMIALAEGARRLGHDLWAHPRLKPMFTLPGRYLMPDGTLPRFGDDVNTRPATLSRLFEPAFQAYGDAALLPFLTAAPTWESILAGRDVSRTGAVPALGSEVFPGAGHAILRGGGPKNLAAVMTFGPYGGFHGHFDKLSFVLFGLGEELGVDPGRAASQAYRLPIHKDWYKATLSHNTVLADGQSQAGVAGALDFFEVQGSWSLALASCTNAYPETRHRRLLALNPDYLVVFDQLDSDVDRRFDWLYHSRGETVARDLPVSDAAGDEGGVSPYFSRVKTASTDGAVCVQIPNKGTVTHLLMEGVPGTGVLLGDGPGASIDERVPLVRITRRGRRVRFSAVLEPVRGAPPAVRGIRVTEEKGAVRLEVERAGGTDVIEIDPGGRVRTGGGQAR